MKNLNGLRYESVLEMISAFQWFPEQNQMRISADIDTKSPVVESIARFTASVSILHEKSTEDYTSLIPKAMFSEKLLLSAQQSREVISEAQRVIEFIGVGGELIGVSNLCSVAFGLVVRNVSPKLWNEFCYDVDRPDWITDIRKQSSRVSRSLGGVDHENVVGLSPQRHNDVQEIIETHPSVDGEEYLEAHIRQRHAGLAAAFDDKEFNASVEKLLGGAEDRDAQQTVVTGEDSQPSRASRFHQVIEDKYNAIRTKQNRNKRRM